MNRLGPKSWTVILGGALILFLAVSLGGVAVGGISMDSTPVSPAVKATEIVEGTVSSLTSPASNGVGPVFAILNDQVTIDASAADVKSGDPSGGPADVQIGSRVVALLTPVVGGGSDRVATAVYVLPTANAATLHGPVDGIDLTAGTFKVASVTVLVTKSTAFGGYGLASLADLHVGDVVLAVVSSSSGGATTADRVLRLGNTPSPMERIQGTVVSIGTTSWVLSVAGKETTIEVGAQTRIIGAPKAGDDVEALGRTDSAGVFSAFLIVAIHAPPVSLKGVVVSEGSTSWVIAALGATTASTAAVNTTVKIDSSTKIVGSPALGDTVEVVATKQSDGSLLALGITKVAVPPPTPVTLRGTVVSESSTSWVIAALGATPGATAAVNTTVKVDSSTKIVGSPAVGDTVEVVATKASDGSLLALVITKVAVPSAVTLQGVVVSIKGMEWTVGNTKVNVTPLTVIVGSPKVGDTVKVQGIQLGASSVVEAAIITKL